MLSNILKHIHPEFKTRTRIIALIDPTLSIRSRMINSTHIDAISMPKETVKATERKRGLVQHCIFNAYFPPEEWGNWREVILKPSAISPTAQMRIEQIMEYA